VKRVRLLVSLLLVLVVLSGAVSPVTAKTMTNINEARVVAEKFIKKISITNEFSDWKNARTGRIIPAYDMDENITAYIIELVKDGNYTGYIVVSAKRSNFPILEFSKGKSPLMRAKELGIKAEKIYRIGGLKYFVGSEGKYYDLNKREINFEKFRENLRKAAENVKVKERITKRSVEAEKQWKYYLSGVTGTTLSASSWCGQHIYDVPAFLWDDGCSPTAAAMVLEYWGEHGYPNLDLPDWWYTEPTDEGDSNGYDNPPNEHMDLTEELHLAMGTSDEDGSTWFWNIDDGINAVASSYGYSFFAWNTWLPVWGQIINEIDAGRPFVLSMWQSGTYGDHSVTVIGFLGESESGAQYLTIHDTWDKVDHYLAFGDWWGAVATWVWP